MTTIVAHVARLGLSMQHVTAVASRESSMRRERLCKTGQCEPTLGGRAVWAWKAAGAQALAKKTSNQHG